MNPQKDIQERNAAVRANILKGFVETEDLLEKARMARQPGERKVGADGITRVWTQRADGKMGWRRVKKETTKPRTSKSDQRINLIEKLIKQGFSPEEAREKVGEAKKEGRVEQLKIKLKELENINTKEAVEESDKIRMEIARLQALDLLNEKSSPSKRSKREGVNKEGVDSKNPLGIEIDSENGVLKIGDKSVEFMVGVDGDFLTEKNGKNLKRPEKIISHLRKVADLREQLGGVERPKDLRRIADFIEKQMDEQIKNLLT